MFRSLPLIVLALSSTALTAGETRQLDAHVHGSGGLDMAIDGTTVVMELHVPGADIVGFEYVADSQEDQAAVSEAIEILSAPLDLFQMSEAAACTVTQAAVDLEIETEEAHDDHGHDEQGHGDDHGGEHAENEHGHEDHGHDETAGATHSEFHAEYTLTCANPDALDSITFAYFDTFPNAVELDIQIVSDGGARSFEVERDTPVLDLGGLF